MAVSQNTYVVVALGAFWHLGALVEGDAIFEVTRKERVNLRAAKHVRDATEEEIEAFRSSESKAPTKAKTSTSTEGDPEKLAAAKETTKAAK